jgi:small subunit ribosomal protein S9
MAEYRAVGRRKNAVARVRIKPGSGKFTINRREMSAYFSVDIHRQHVELPLVKTDRKSAYDISANVAGGGPSGQAGAVRHGLARCLQAAEPDLRAALKSAGLLTRDPRMVERKKSGQPGARRRFQFSKR